MAIAKLKDQVDLDDDAPRIEGAAIEGPQPDLVETPTSRKIYQACAHAQNTPTIALVYGGAGVSKTTTAERYQRDHRGAYHVNLQGVVTPSAMLVTVAERVYPPALAGSYRNVAIMRSLTYHLRPGELIILDEAQSLRADALDSVRFLLDDAGVGLVLMGNDHVFSAIAGKNRRATFAQPQLLSRIGMKLHLPHPTEADADAVLKSFGVTGGAGRDYGRQLALGQGALRGLVTVLRQARVVALAKKRDLDHQLMYAVANALGLSD